MRVGRVVPPVAALTLTVAALAVWGTVVWKGAPGLPRLFAGLDWAPPLLLSATCPALGSLATVFGGLLLGAGGGYLAASHLVYERPWGAGPLLALFEAGAWVPTVVLGLLGVTWLLPALRPLNLVGYGLLPAALLLAAFAFWPAVGLYTACLSRLPEPLLMGGMALGGREAVIRRLLTPAAVRKALWAQTSALGGRLLGEATAVALVVGNSGLFPPSPTKPSVTLPSVLLTEAVGAPMHGPWQRAIWAMALLLLLGSAALHLGLRRWIEEG